MRKIAEILDKQWLMGVRRGWLSLLKPNINGWSDVPMAFDRLLEFVSNLQDQVMYVRRAPLAMPNSTGGEKLQKLFGSLTAALKDAKDRALAWKRIAEGGGPAPSEYDLEASAKMLNLYRTDFKESLDTWVPTKGKGPGGARHANITELLDKVLAVLRENAKRLDKAIKTEDELGLNATKRLYEEASFKEFQYGKLKVVVTDPKMGGSLIRGYIKYFEQFYQLMKRKGFGKVLYGTLFLESASPKHLSDSEKQAYANAGYLDLRTIAGTYSHRKDVVVVSNAPNDTLVTLMAHEFGHRYWFKIMNGTQRAKFDGLVRTMVQGQPKPAMPALFVDDQRDEIMDLTASVLKEVKVFEASSKPPREAIDTFEKALDRPMMKVARYLSALRNQVKPYVDRKDQGVNRAWREVQKRLDDIKKHERSLKMMFREAIKEFFDFDRNRNAWADTMRKLVFGLEGEVISYLHTAESSAQQSYVDNVPRIDPNDPRKVLPVSDYGGTNADEAFAEVFAFYVTGKNMNRDQLESFRSVLSSVENLSLAELIVQRYLNDRHNHY